MKLKIGDKAPNFEGPNEKGEMINLEQYRGKTLVLYFYPKDDTPGCTAEACSLRDGYRELKQAGIEILGVSPDKSGKHQKFINKYDPPFSLLADENHGTLEAYGVWGLKKFMGREYMGVNRTTFIIGDDGKIQHIIDKVDTKNHAQQIMDLLGIA